MNTICAKPKSNKPIAANNEIKNVNTIEEISLKLNLSKAYYVKSIC